MYAYVIVRTACMCLRGKQHMHTLVIRNRIKDRIRYEQALRLTFVVDVHSIYIVLHGLLL